jgi:succinate dehydrogenase / fumarate reductase membrane anchor subunit
MSLRSPLGRVLGHGSAGDGVHHWWVQRLTSVALVVLGIWFVFSIASLPLANFDVLTEWMRQGWNALLLLIFVLVAVWHSQLGVQVVIEDYVHEGRTVVLVLSTFLHVLIAAALVYAILKIAL